MKIGIDASRYSEKQATGVETYSRYIIDGLLQKIAESDENHAILYSKMALEKYQSPSKHFRNQVIKANRFWTLMALSREMRSAPPDVLFVPSHTLPLLLAPKNVITIHDTAFRKFKSSYSFLQYHYLNWSTKFAVKNASHIIVPSDSTKNDLISDFNCSPNKLTVIKHGFDEAHFTENEIDEEYISSVNSKILDMRKDLPYLLFIGRLESKKNLVQLIKSFSFISKKYPKYSLILAGKPGVGFKKIKEAIEKSYLSGRVFITGYVSEKEKAALYKGASVFLFPSLYEGFGFPILESFYYKTPVITSNVSSMPEVGGNAVEYVDPNDCESLINAIETLISSEEYSNRLVELGTARLLDFSWNKSAAQTLEVLLNC